MSGEFSQPKPAPMESEIGLRVSIRMHDPEGGFRDLLGTLATLTSVTKKDGTTVTFDPTTIALWKVVPSDTTMRRQS